MFYIEDMERTVMIRPDKFGEDMSQVIKEQLSEDIEGEMYSNGVIIALYELSSFDDAIVPIGESSAYIRTKFKALVFEPEIGAVYEGEVKEVLEFGAFLGIGPFDALIHVSQMMDDFINYDPKNKSFIGRDSNKVLSQGDIVYAKLISRSFANDVLQSKLAMTMRQKGLGKLEWIQKDKENKDKKE